jgi:hypothetical protein
MNKDAEAINLLAWLLQEPDPAISAPSGENSSQQIGPDKSGAVELQSRYLDPLDSEEIALPTDLRESGSFPIEEVSLFKSGEIPAVQDRFYALIKHRLRAEIERNPPLFPWETEACDYDESSEQLAPALVSTSLWTAQLQSLELPVPMPDALLIKLFEQCQAVAQSSLREGAKLVRAVETLFPGHSQALNQLAGLVLAAPARSGAATRAQAANLATKGFPSHYDAATSAQQMALSLLAARKILDTITLKLSPSQPQTEREWLTAAGALVLKAEYQPQLNRLKIQSQLPCQGSLRLQAEATQSTAKCSSAGELSIELSGVKPGQLYSLEVQLAGAEQPPFTFAVCPIAEDE